MGKQLLVRLHRLKDARCAPQETELGIYTLDHQAGWVQQNPLWLLRNTSACLEAVSHLLLIMTKSAAEDSNSVP